MNDKFEDIYSSGTQKDYYLPFEFGGEIQIKKYTEVFVAGTKFRNLDFSSLVCGAEIELKPEPNNAYDPLAIAIFQKGTHIGYIPKNNLQNVIHSNLKKGKTFRGGISYLNEEEQVIKIDFAFYDSVDDYASCHSGVCVNLVDTIKDNYGESIQDNYNTLTENDVVFLSYNDVEKRFEVYTDDFFDVLLGRVSKNDSMSLLLTYDSEILFGVVNEKTYCKNGNAGAKITVYYSDAVSRTTYSSSETVKKEDTAPNYAKYLRAERKKKKTAAKEKNKVQSLLIGVICFLLIVIILLFTIPNTDDEISTQTNSEDYTEEIDSNTPQEDESQQISISNSKSESKINSNDEVVSRYKSSKRPTLFKDVSDVKISDIGLDIVIRQPDSINTVYMDAVYVNNSQYTITSFSLTVLLKDKNKKTYLTCYDTVLTGEASPKFDSFGPQTQSRDDIEFLECNYSYLDENGKKVYVTYDYKLKTYKVL